MTHQTHIATKRFHQKQPRRKQYIMQHIMLSERNSINAAVVFYAILFVTTLSTLVTTCYNYPLFPIQYDSLEWNRTWLITTVMDYYGACLCFCGVVLSTETSWVTGLAWVGGFCLFGSPVCCVWVLVWLLREGGSLRLEKRRDAYQTSL